jgi:hypothetical protein
MWLPRYIVTNIPHLTTKHQQTRHTSRLSLHDIQKRGDESMRIDLLQCNHYSSHIHQQSLCDYLNKFYDQDEELGMVYTFE